MTGDALQGLSLLGIRLHQVGVGFCQYPMWRVLWTAGLVSVRWDLANSVAVGLSN